MLATFAQSKQAMTEKKQTNMERMFLVIDEVFDMRNDPLQLQVNDKVIAKLAQIHPATLSEYNEGEGPIAWVLVIPTTTELMNRFVAGQLSEQALFDQTKPGMQYDALYLCSATTLPEYRGKGITKKLCLDAIKKISEGHPLKALFVWAFSPEGNMLAESVARATGLPLLKREIKKLN
ncbi:MAG TPA: hypothetical protein VI757_09255 [Bacteroidia bacterium]|nr:hypothetical protein [Bacteroidia bacterium]